MGQLNTGTYGSDAAVDYGPKFSKAYWEDWDEPQFKCKSRVLEILDREVELMQYKAKRGK